MKTYRLDHLTPIQKTLLITLKGRALDSQSAKPILRDPLAADLMSRIDYDLDTVNVSNTVVLAVAVRSIILDRVVRTFVNAHPDAVVVELGSGMETRQYRLDPPPTVDWYDVDYPEVIRLREELLPPRANAHPIGASLQEGDWVEKIPGDRPTILVADGVIGFLSEAANQKLLTGITDHFAGGEMIFNAYAKIIAGMIGRGMEPATKSVGLQKGHSTYGLGDPQDVVALNPRLTFVEEHTAYTHPDAEWINARFTGLTRFAANWFAHWPAQARRGVWVVRYRF